MLKQTMFLNDRDSDIGCCSMIRINIKMYLETTLIN